MQDEQPAIYYMSGEKVGQLFTFCDLVLSSRFSKIVSLNAVKKHDMLNCSHFCLESAGTLQFQHYSKSLEFCEIHNRIHVYGTTSYNDLSAEKHLHSSQ